MCRDGEMVDTLRLERSAQSMQVRVLFSADCFHPIMNKFFFVIAWWLCTLSAAYAVDYENALIYYGTGTFVSKT